MPLAIVTGASTGLGLKIAEKLANKKYDLLLVARGEAGLRQAASGLQGKGVRVDYCAADLGTTEGLARLEAEIKSRSEIEVLVNNAGFGTYGKFWELPVEEEVQELELNIHAVVRLTRAVLPGMVAWRKGTVINVASTAAFQPVPYFATYAGTKAFILHFSEAVNAELKGNGVKNVEVSALCPGPLATGFQARAGVKKEEYGMIPWESLDAVAQQAVDLIGKGRGSLVTGFVSGLVILANRLTPRNIVAVVAEKMFRPRGERPAGAGDSRLPQ